jgi:ribonuclease T2
MRYLVALLCWFAVPVSAQGSGRDLAGQFDYYVLALSWSANWCAIEGDARGSPQCDRAEQFDWVLHGLWPQYETGYPTDCASNFAPPSRTQTAQMGDIMGTSGLAWHQWRKHGSCSGLSPADYFALSRRAYDQITRPPVFRGVNRDITLPASLIEDAFLRDNRGLRADQITITCRQGYIQEARICLTRDLDLRRCGADVIRDCSLDSAKFNAMR